MVKNSLVANENFVICELPFGIKLVSGSFGTLVALSEITLKVLPKKKSSNTITIHTEDKKLVDRPHYKWRNKAVDNKYGKVPAHFELELTDSKGKKWYIDQAERLNAFNFNNFTLIFLLTGGGPPIIGSEVAVGWTDILISFTYKLAISGGRGNLFGLASSVTIIIFFIVLVISAISFRYTKRLEKIYGNI